VIKPGKDRLAVTAPSKSTIDIVTIGPDSKSFNNFIKEHRDMYIIIPDHQAGLNAWRSSE
jgi:hypothetical protein